MSNEQYKVIIGFQGYEVSNLGNVRNRRTGRVLRQTLNRDGGYLHVNLYRGGVGRTSTVHRLVATAFHENPKDLSDVNHKDSCRTNNHASNLEWMSRGDNIRHGVGKGHYGKHGRKPDKYPASLVVSLWERNTNGESYNSLAVEIGTTAMQVRLMVLRAGEIM